MDRARAHACLVGSALTAAMAAVALGAPALPDVRAASDIATVDVASLGREPAVTPASGGHTDPSPSVSEPPLDDPTPTPDDDHGMADDPTPTPDDDHKDPGDPHGDEATVGEKPRAAVLGGFAAINTLVLAAAAITRRRDRARAAAKSALSPASRKDASR